MAGKIVLDVTSLVLWAGPPVGIVRVVHALATAIRNTTPERLVAYDAAAGVYRVLSPRWMDSVLGWSGLVNRHIPQRFPRNLASRAGMVNALERVRLTTRLAPIADRLQRAILAPRPHQFPLEDKDGNRIANVPTDLAYGPPFRFASGDVLLLAGMGWSYLPPERLAALKAESGCRVSAICYDLIPVTHPRFYSDDDQRMFAAWWRGMAPLLDHWVLSAAAIRQDVHDWCEALGLPAPDTAIVPFGYDPAPESGTVSLPAGLRPGGFALFVSTIEQRKGHAVLLDAWERLLALGIPRTHDFRLVFVGRPGWMVDDVLSRLATPPWGVVHLSGCSDAELNALYRGAAFCCYPSQYEGYGLPLIEAFARGKAVLSSNGGALKETADTLASCIDPNDSEAWAAAMAAWITQPALVAARAATIAANFRHPDWSEAAETIVDVVSRGLTGDFRQSMGG